MCTNFHSTTPQQHVADTLGVRGGRGGSEHSLALTSAAFLFAREASGASFCGAQVDFYGARSAGEASLCVCVCVCVFLCLCLCLYVLFWPFPPLCVHCVLGVLARPPSVLYVL